MKHKNIDCKLVIQLPKEKWGNTKILIRSNPTSKREMGKDNKYWLHISYPTPKLPIKQVGKHNEKKNVVSSCIVQLT